MTFSRPLRSRESCIITAPGRRAFLGAVSALSVGGTIPSAALANVGADAELVDLVDQILATEAKADRLGDLADAAEDRAEHDRLWDEMDALTDTAHDLFAQAVALPATTRAGMRAKASLLLQRVQRDAAGAPLSEDAALMASVARDILRGAGA